MSSWDGPGFNFNDPANWDAGVPSNFDTAVFNTANPHSLSLSTDTGLSQLIFKPGAASYTITVPTGANLFFDLGAGVTNDSGQTQTISSTGGVIYFSGNTSAGQTTIMTSGAGVLSFRDAAQADNAVIINDGSGGVSLSALTSPGIVAGSIQGSGRFFLGSKTLTVGGNGLSTTVSGVIEGVGGSLTKTGDGTLSLTGNNTYQAGTEINEGVLSIISDQNLGAPTGGLTISNNATLRASSWTSNRLITLLTGGGTFDTDGISTLTNSIGGTTLTKTGPGWLVLSGNNSYQNGTVIRGGTLNVSHDYNLGFFNGTLTFSNGAILQTDAALNTGRDIVLNAGGGVVDTNGFNSTFSGILSGVGGFAKAGGGKLTLSNFNTYQGGTMIEGGTLAIASDSSLGDSAGDLSLYGGTLETDSALTIARAAHVIVGGTVDTHGFNSTLSGMVDGDGYLTKIGAGTLTLSGNNTYTGGTIVTGGILRISSDMNLGSPVNGATLTLGGGTLQLAGAWTSARGLHLYPGGGIIDTNGFNASLSGSITGTGPLTKSGAGALALSGISAYNGGTLINGGILAIQNDNTLGDLAGGLTISNGTLQTNAAIMSARSILISGVFNTVNTNGFNSVFSGTISGGVGSELVKAGAGTLTLSGTNSYSGGISIQNGVLRIANDSNLGNLSATISFFNNAVLQITSAWTTSRIIGLAVGGGTIDTNGFDAASLGTIFGPGGTGMLTKIGAGMLFLSGTNSYTGGTAIEGGTLSIADEGNLGYSGGVLVFDNGAILQTRAAITSGRAVTLMAGGGVVDTSGFDAGFSGNIGGEGSLTKTGAGTLTLTGANTYSGGTTVDAGILRVGAPQALPDGGTATLANSGGALLDLNNFDQTLASLSGGGAAGGNLALGNAILTLGTDDRSTTYSGAISGTGSLVKMGAGTFTLAGANTYTGTTQVNVGTLNVTGSLQGDVVVDAAGALCGTGRIGNVINRGAMTPGSRQGGVLSVASYSGPGALNISFNGSSHNALTVAGNAALTEGTLNLSGTNFVTGQYSVLTASSVTGAFSSVTTPAATTFLTFSTLYTPTDVKITIDTLSLASIAESGNQGAVATAMDVNKAGAAGAFLADIDAIAQLSASQARQAYEQISGDALASFQNLGMRSAANFTDHMHDRSARLALASTSRAQMAEAPAESDRIWARGVGFIDHVDADPSIGSPGSQTSTDGFQAGYDYPIREDMLVGFSGGYAKTTVSVDDRFSSGSAATLQSGLYASYSPRPWRIQGSLAYASLANTMARSIDFPGVHEQADSHFGSRLYTTYVKAGYVYESRERWSLEPSLALRQSYLRQEGFTESGAPGLDLRVEEETVNSFVLSPGLRLSRSFLMNSSRPMSLAVRAAWEHELGDIDNFVTARFAQSSGGGPFMVEGTPHARNAVVVGVDGRLNLTKNLQAFTDYALTKSSNQHTQAISGGLSLKW